MLLATYWKLSLESGELKKQEPWNLKNLGQFLSPEGIPEVRGLDNPQWWCSVCDSAKIISHPSLVIYFLVTTRIFKTKIGTARLLMANHLNHSNHELANEKQQGSSSQIIIIPVSCFRFIGAL